MSRARRRRKKRLQANGPKRNFIRADLHLHTLRSDGENSPEEILRKAMQARLNLIAITDHDIPPMLRGGTYTLSDWTLRLLEGVEITASFQGEELHFLIYFAEQMPEIFVEFCRTLAQKRAERYNQMVEQLSLPNIAFASEEATRGEMALTRRHLAKALVDQGHAHSIYDAFGKWLHGLQRGSLGVSVEEVIERGRAAGGFVSWAHPPLKLAQAQASLFAQIGLDALEAVRPAKKYRKSLREIAKNNHMHITGGSDYHGYRSQFGMFSFSGKDIVPWAERLHINPYI